MRRPVRLTAAVCAVLMFSSAGINSAMAANTNLTDAVCTAGVVNGTGFSASTGDTVTITANLTGCEKLAVSTRVVTSPSDVVVAGVGVGSVTLVGNSYEVTATSFSSIQVTFTNTVSNTAGIQLGNNVSFGVRRTQWVISYTGTGGSSGGGTGSSSVPAPVVQEFGLPASGTCDAAAGKDLNWAGVPSGGWSVSWGQWMNGGKGGAVCTRTLAYNTLTAAWGVAS